MEKSTSSKILLFGLCLFAISILGCGTEPAPEFQLKNNNVSEISDISGKYSCKNSVGQGGIEHGGGDCTLGNGSWLIKIGDDGTLTKYGLETCQAGETYNLVFDSTANVYRGFGEIRFTKEGNKLFVTESPTSTCSYQCELEKYTDSKCSL